MSSSNENSGRETIQLASETASKTELVAPAPADGDI